MIVHAYGICESSPLVVSDTLRALNISHSLAGVPFDLGFPQPYEVVILNKAYIPKSKTQQVVFICAPAAILKTTNLRLLKCDDLYNTLKEALIYASKHPFNPGWELQNNPKSILDFVNLATKPSYLNKLQESLYKITPYSLRKEAQTLIISYLASKASRKDLFAKLNSSWKFATLKELLDDPKAVKLKDAVSMYYKVNDEVKVAEATGFETFEILYIARSAAIVKT